MKLALVLLLALALPAAASEPKDSLWGEILRSRVSPAGEVSYRTLAAFDGEPLGQYLASLAGAEPARMSHDAQLAFWINAYNAMVVFAVIHGERTEPFDKRSRMFHWFRTEIAGARRTLDDIEEILARYAATDPRIHFALCNGTRSAPRLALQPYRADDLDAALASTVRDFVNDTQKNRFVPERQRADVSRIFAWHRVDFERAGGSIAAYLRTFVREPGADALLDEADVTIGFLEYDWTLNAAPKEMPR